jgi:hypothetical protein
VRKCDCQKHKHCLNCDKRMRRSAKTVNGYCAQCWEMGVENQRSDFTDPADGYLKGRKQCIVRGCPNMSDQGTFVGDLCAPCHTFVTTGEGRYSQAYRNSLHIVAASFSRVVIKGLVHACDPTGQKMLGSSIADAAIAKLVRG